MRATLSRGGCSANTMSNSREPSTKAPTLTEQLRRNPLVLHAPVTALCILIGVCVTGLVLIGDPMALLAVAPLGAVVALYFGKFKPRNTTCIGHSSPSRS